MKRGFTLIELLLVLAVGVIIIEAAYTIYIFEQKHYQKRADLAELSQNARIGLDRIAREIRQTTSVISSLPLDESFPGANEIIFEDGHTPVIQYIRYYLDGINLMRQQFHYYLESDFSDCLASQNDPTKWVIFGTSSALPCQDSLEVIAENISKLEFYGTNVITIYLTTSKKEQKVDLKAGVFARNL